MEAEFGMMCLKAKRHQELPAISEAKKKT
jgi:hypothetical protein